MIKVFIDGKDGTTGLKIYERFGERKDIELLHISPDKRKKTEERKKLINSADICFLCLPDAAAAESVSLVEENSGVKIIDTSTAHRTADGWSYGFPELSENHRHSIEQGMRIAVPGCHASGFNSIVYPLRSMGVLPADYPLVCYSVTGYSGGGKKMIGEYESDERDFQLDSPRQYGLSQSHKHLKEMKAVPMLERAPVFSPIVSDYYSGMTVSIPLFTDMLTKKYTVKEIHALLSEHYEKSEMVKVLPLTAVQDMGNMLSANALSGKDTMEIMVSGNDERILIASRFDNLGKGASGAAIQCMNIMLGLDETTGLSI